MMTDKYHNDVEEQVLRTLLYFDIFNYPLNAAEVFAFLRVKENSVGATTKSLDSLVERKIIFRFGNLYSLHADEKNIRRRLKGNTEAEKWLQVAQRQAGFIGKFPFVRAVMASGSLSKGYMDEKSDLDFFVVTTPGRLWIARTLLVMYKRIFLANSHKMFCVNYFVDAEHLEIEEKNIFTATELVTLIPLYNVHGYQSVMDSNAWVKGFFPNFERKKPPVATNEGSAGLRRLSELLFFPLTGWLDKFFMYISLKRWIRLYGGQYSREDFEIAFKTRRHVSKNHPNHYQKKVLERYQRKVMEFQNRLAQLPTYE